MQVQPDTIEFTTKEMFTMFSQANSLRRLRRTGLAAAFMLALVPQLHAAGVPTERVYVGDLELATDLGQHQMQRRVEIAIAKLCAPETSAVMPQFRLRKQVRECRALAWADVQAQLSQHGVALSLAQARR
jgi:UrcA family protein